MSIHHGCLQQANQLALWLSWECAGLHCCIFWDRTPAGDFFSILYIFLCFVLRFVFYFATFSLIQTKTSMQRSAGDHA